MNDLPIENIYATGQYRCGKCSMIFISFQALMRHSKCVGGRIKSNRFKCDLCPYTTNISTNFKNHKLTHSTERPFTCPVCGMGFIQKQNMKNHFVQHTKLMPGLKTELAELLS